MTSKSESKPKNAKIFDLDEYEKLLKGIQVAACMLTETPIIVDEQSVIKRVSALTLEGFSGGEQCSCCGVGPFESRAQQTAHYKHHWHTHNLKRRLFGKSPLTLQQFNSRKDEDNSSVSGSDSETENCNVNCPASDLFAAATRHCKAFFTNSAGQVFCIYRCILHHRKEEISADGEGKMWVERCRKMSLPGFQRWAVFMISGGHFAGAVFSGAAPVLHKTQHSYVVRRGQGQAQGARDQHGNAPKSAGASLRRYNQAQFVQHVHDILNSWTDDLAGCSLILYRAVGQTNQNALFGKGSPLTKDDLRVRALPFPTRKPSYKEVQRAHATVANVEIYDSMELFQKALVAAKGKIPARTDASSGDRIKKTTPNKPVLNRAKSRERPPRELPIQVTSSEDEGPCFIDSETPPDWIKTLSEQSSNGVITASRKDLLNNDLSIGRPESSDDEEKTDEKVQTTKKKKKKKPEGGKKEKTPTPSQAVKIPLNVKKMWKVIQGNECQSLDIIFESWEPGELGVSMEDACNTVDPNDGNTALHKAAIAAKPEMVTQILNAGGDPCIRNHQLQTPYAASPHQDTRIAFRLFQAENPDKYNYAKAHIPGPLTPVLLEQEREKKAAQKKAKRQRDKEKQLEKIRLAKFVEMKDDEKVRSKESRCFLCGVQLPKVPFEYDNYQFCTIRCLQNHRSLRPLHMPA